MAYLSPSTMDNQELRQCLSYFFPVYCYSSPANQRCMREVSRPVSYPCFYPDAELLFSLIMEDIHPNVRTIDDSA